MKNAFELLRNMNFVKARSGKVYENAQVVHVTNNRSGCVFTLANLPHGKWVSRSLPRGNHSGDFYYQDDLSILHACVRLGWITKDDVVDHIAWAKDQHNNQYMVKKASALQNALKSADLKPSAAQKKFIERWLSP